MRLFWYLLVVFLVLFVATPLVVVCAWGVFSLIEGLCGHGWAVAWTYLVGGVLVAGWLYVGWATDGGVL